MKTLIAFLISSLFVSEVQAMVQEREYQFGLGWSVNGLESSIDVQGIMLNFTGMPSDLDTRLPISQYLKDGRNKIELYTWPFEYEAESELRITLLYWHPGENPNTEANTAFEIIMMPGQDDAKPEIVSLDTNAPLQPLQDDISFNRYEDNDVLEVTFNNHQVMPEWCWEKGDVLSDTDDVRNSLAREYRRLYSLFEAKNNDALMDASRTMIEELAIASGESQDYVRHRASFTMFFDNSDLFQLDSFPEEPMILNLAADNRVAWLTREGVAAPIRFRHVGNEEAVSNVRLYFIQRNGQWEICR